MCAGALRPLAGLAFQDLAVLRCERCSLAHLHRTSTAPDYDSFALDAFRADPRGYLEAHHYGILDHLDAALSARAKAGSPRRLLDVGCSFGAVVHRARARGWDAVGVDTDADRIAAGSEHTPGLLCGDMSHPDLREGSFDAVVMWHVLEHVPDPLAALEQVRRLLREDGTLFLEVPNLASPIAWLVYRRRWLGFETPGHLFAFTTTTLLDLLRKASFHPVRVTRPVIAERFPGGFKGLARSLIFSTLGALEQGDAIRVMAEVSVA